MRRVKTPILLALTTLLGLPLLAPLMSASSVPCTHDGHLHYHRVIAIGQAWRDGIWFSRWLPDLAFGYGYPFFLYREPLPLYVVHWLHLGGLPLPAATNLFYALGSLMGGWFTLLWARDLFGDRAGLVAALAYMAAPYVLADTLIRGNQPEATALALFPLLLWSGRRYLLTGRRRWLGLTLAGYAALGLSHNISLLLFTPAYFLYLLLIARWRQVPARTWLVRLGIIFGLGLGLTAFYAGSAVLEINAVTLTQSVVTRNNDYHYNFASLGEILAPVRPEDPTLLNPPLLFRLGWVPLLLALVGLWRGRRIADRERRNHVWLLAGAVGVFLFFALPASLFLWERVPLIDFVQFPWRLIGRAALPLAALAGAAFAPLPGEHRHWPRLAPLAAGLILLEALPLLYPAVCQEIGFPDINVVHQYEHETGLVGVDPEGSYFPITVAQRPTGSPLEADYQAGRTPRRFDETSLPAGARLVSADYGPNRAAIVVNSPEPFTAQYLTFAFAGWRAAVDGAPVAISASDPAGLITFPVPAGEHTLTVTWGSTTQRTLLGLGSGLALLATLALLISPPPGGTKGGQNPNQSPATANADTPLLTSPHRGEEPISLPPGGIKGGQINWRPWLLTALLLITFKWLIVDRVDSPWRRPGTPPVEVATTISGGELELAGYNLSRTAVPAGETIDVDLAWLTRDYPATRYQSNLWLADANGLLWSDKETQRPRLYEDPPPVPAWPPGTWAWDSREIAVLPGTPPGRYDLVLTLFRLEDLSPLTLVDGAGQPLGPTTVIGQIEVTLGSTGVVPQYPRRAEVRGLNLLGFNQDRTTAAPGDELLLTLFWRAADAGAPDLIDVELRDADGAAVQGWAIPPVAGFPPAQWTHEAQLRGQHLLRLAPDLAGGAYSFWLDGTRLGDLTVTAPERVFALPAGLRPQDADFAGQLRLAGYRLAPDCFSAAICTVTLAWEGTAVMTTGYHVFVHAVAADGALLTQADGVPAAWARPTTGWTPGEYVLDEHVLAWPDGAAPARVTLRVGVYDPADGTRLAVDDADFWVLDGE